MATNRLLKRVLAWSLILLFGCAKQYDIQSSGDHGPTIRLRAGVAILVAVPKDGGYGVESVEGSGMMTARAVAQAFSRYSKNVHSAGVHASREENLEGAQSQDFQYLVLPTILRWEERLIKNFGKPDRVVVKLELIDVASEEVVDVTILTGKSRRIPPVDPEQQKMEDSRPQQFLLDALPHFVASLFVR